MHHIIGYTKTSNHVMSVFFNPFSNQEPTYNCINSFMLLYTWHNAMNRLKIKETMSHIVFVINISFKNLSLAKKKTK